MRDAKCVIKNNLTQSRKDAKEKTVVNFLGVLCDFA
jgi:hypothetical protein